MDALIHKSTMRHMAMGMFQICEFLGDLEQFSPCLTRLSRSFIDMKKVDLFI